jgi:lipoprotein-releasing system permease protein
MTNARLASWIAARYLRSRSAGRFAPLLRVTAIASIALGITALIVVMSVMRGFRRDLADRLLGFNAHITLTRTAAGEPLARDDVERLLQDASVRDIAPFVQGEVIAQTLGSEPNAQGARVRGIDPASLGAMGSVHFYFPEGSAGLADVAPEARGALPAAIIGSEVVAQLSVHPDFEDALELTAPLAELAPTGELMPSRMRVRVAGVFRAGIFDYDSKYILMSLDEARRLLGEEAMEGWQVRLARATDVPRVLAPLRARLPEGWEASGVDTKNRKLFAALALERLAMGGILAMVLVIASCATAGIVLLVIQAKRKDIAILAAIGVTPRSIRQIFLIHAALIGALGSSIGLAAGIGICLAMGHGRLRLPSSYYLEFLPVELSVGTAILFAAAGVAIAIAAALVPVRSASRLDPVEILRYE